MTLPDVAAEMGLAPKAIAYYFRRKEDVAVAAFLSGLDRLATLVGSSRGATPAARVSDLIARFFGYQARAERGEAPELTSPNDIRAMNSAPIAAAYADFFRATRALLAEDGTLGRQEANARTHLLVSELHWFNAWRTHLHSDDYDRAARVPHRRLAAGPRRGRYPDRSVVAGAAP